MPVTSLYLKKTKQEQVNQRTSTLPSPDVEVPVQDMSAGVWHKITKTVTPENKEYVESLLHYARLALKERGLSLDTAQNVINQIDGFVIILAQFIGQILTDESQKTYLNIAVGITEAILTFASSMVTPSMENKAANFYETAEKSINQIENQFGPKIQVKQEEYLPQRVDVPQLARRDGSPKEDEASQANIVISDPVNQPAWYSPSNVWHVFSVKVGDEDKVRGSLLSAKARNAARFSSAKDCKKILSAVKALIVTSLSLGKLAADPQTSTYISIAIALIEAVVTHITTGSMPAVQNKAVFMHNTAVDSIDEMDGLQITHKPR